MDWQERYKNLSDEEARAFIKKYAAKTSPLQEIDFVPDHAHGLSVWNEDGKRRIDFSGNICEEGLGHDHPAIASAVEFRLREKIPDLSSNVWPCKPKAELLRTLIPLIPGGFDKKVFFSVGGAGANEDARKRIIHAAERSHTLVPMFAFQDAFHGGTFGTLPLHDSKPERRRYFVNEWERAHFLPFPAMTLHHASETMVHDCKEYERVAAPRIKALLMDAKNVRSGIFVECVQGEGGAHVGCFDCLPKVIERFQREGHYFVDDEIQMGFWRTGKRFACEHSGITPDMMTFGKMFSQGTDLSATVYPAELEYRWYSANSSTGPSVQGFLNTLAVLEAVETIVQSGYYAQGEEILKATAPYGLGYFRRIECKDAKQKDLFMKIAYQRGLIVLSAGDRYVRVSPPYPSDEESLNQLIEGVVMLEAVKKTVGI